MNRFLMWLLISAALYGQTVIAQDQVLIYTRNGEGYVHDNIEAASTALLKICKDLGMQAEVSDDPKLFTKSNLAGYKVIIFNNTNNEAFTKESQREAFVDYIRSGRGFVAIHSACASERDWPWYWAMVGGTFVRHPKMQPFDIHMIDPDHPTTEFLPQIWPWEDECYFMNHLNPDIHVLYAADLRTIEDEKKQEYPGDTFGNYFPLAWVHEFEDGRQFYTALGHKIAHYEDPLFVRHLKAGIAWSAKMKP
jgi:type 1 glutamine amidotransferase